MMMVLLDEPTLMLFESPDKPPDWLEAVDVLNNEYRFCDDNGQLFVGVSTHPGAVPRSGVCPTCSGTSRHRQCTRVGRSSGHDHLQPVVRERRLVTPPPGRPPGRGMNSTRITTVRAREASRCNENRRQLSSNISRESPVRTTKRGMMHDRITGAP